MSVALQDAATVLLLRDGDAGLEVLMGKRSSRTRFSAGAFVFPGGAVDIGDSAAIRYSTGVCAESAQQRFGEPDALRYYLAAARELFEEAGIWLFSATRPENWPDLQYALHNNQCSLESVLDEHAQVFDCGALHYFRFWTTPPGQPRRYRTRFFVAQAPADQHVQVDGVEITEHCWITPRAMLARHAAGEVDLIYPTFRELTALQIYKDAATAMVDLRNLAEVPEMRTRRRVENGRVVQVMVPGDPGYEQLPEW